MQTTPAGISGGPLSAPLPVSVPTLLPRIEATIRRMTRRVDYDWGRFLESDPVWRIAELVHRATVRIIGPECPPSALSIATIRSAADAVLSRWTKRPELRPSESGFLAEQSARGERGRQARAVARLDRNARILEMSAAGISDAEIGRRENLNRSTVGRIRRSATPAKSQVARHEEAGAPPFPAPEMPSTQRWPVTQFAKQTGVRLDANDSWFLAAWGRCYELEGNEHELLAAIRASAGPNVRDPWAYLRRCIANRDDGGGEVDARLLGDVLTRCGRKPLEYALVGIGSSSGYIKKPAPYLREMLRKAVQQGERDRNAPDNPIARSILMAKEWSPKLSIVDADAAEASERERGRRKHLDQCRRLFGSPPWEEAAPEFDLPDAEDPKTARRAMRDQFTRIFGPPAWEEAPHSRCIGLKDDGGDDSLDLSTKIIFEKSSPELHKANATSSAAHDPPTSPCPWRPRMPIAAPLSSITETRCASPGCGCLIYRGSGGAITRCACHWTPAQRRRILR